MFNNIRAIQYPFVLMLSLILFLQCKSPLKSDETYDEATFFVNIYLEAIDEFQLNLEKFNNANLQNNDELNSLYENAKLQFLKFGFLLEYFDKGLYNNFNGAPISKEDASTPAANLIEPMGLQVINEIINASEVDQNKLSFQVDFLINQLKFARKLGTKDNFSNKAILNAISLGLIRFETLSLAGFDNPNLKNEYTYLSTEIDGINRFLSVETDDFSLQIEYDSTLVSNKLKFLKTYLYPFKVQLNKIVATNENTISPVDNFSKNIYEHDFLNPSFYSANGLVYKVDSSKITLGKMLFSDPILSHESIRFSCTTCHLPQQFFTDGRKLSVTNKFGLTLKRNTPTLIHAAYQNKFMYDGRAESLEMQMLHVFNNQQEFKSNFLNLIERLENDSTYIELFEKSYGKKDYNSISIYSITDALATYIRTFNGANSKFDKFMRGEILDIPNEVADGFNLFMGKVKCGTCHFAPTFSGLLPPFYEDSEFENIGVPSINENGDWLVDNDLGRYNFYPNDFLKHFFKTTTVRNTEFTAPYMHNGVFNTIQEVLDFYNFGGGIGHQLEYKNQTLPSDSLSLTTKEMENIEAFINALSDLTYLNY